MDRVLIQNWSKEAKDDLLQFIIESIQGKVEYLEICVAGSRVSGGYRDVSDIDTVVYIESVYKFGHKYRRVKYNGINLSLSFKDYEFFEDDVYYVLGVSINLPRYSLVNDVFYPGNEKHLQYYKGIRSLIKANDGWDIPFEKYDRENAYLLE